jgi:hypothetical protein
MILALSLFLMDVRILKFFVTDNLLKNDVAAQILLTPFRSQNVPPPMSSFQLSVSPASSSTSPSSTAQVPVYATFCPEDDTLGILWEQGYVELWDLRTRLLPGPGKIMDPSKLWAGNVEQGHDIRWRQLGVKLNDSTERAYTVTILGTRPLDSKDTLATVNIQGGTSTASSSIQLPYRNCRLLTGSVADTYQGPDGEIFTCKEFYYFWTLRILIVIVKIHKKTKSSPPSLVSRSFAYTSIGSLLHQRVKHQGSK